MVEVSVCEDEIRKGMLNIKLKEPSNHMMVFNEIRNESLVISNSGIQAINHILIQEFSSVKYFYEHAIGNMEYRIYVRDLDDGTTDLYAVIPYGNAKRYKTLSLTAAHNRVKYMTKALNEAYERL